MTESVMWQTLVLRLMMLSYCLVRRHRCWKIWSRAKTGNCLHSLDWSTPMKPKMVCTGGLFSNDDLRLGVIQCPVTILTCENREMRKTREIEKDERVSLAIRCQVAKTDTQP